MQSLKSQLNAAQNYVLKVTGKAIPQEVLLGDFTNVAPTEWHMLLSNIKTPKTARLKVSNSHVHLPHRFHTSQFDWVAQKRMD